MLSSNENKWFINMYKNIDEFYKYNLKVKMGR